MVDDPADFLISLPDGQRGYYGQGIIKKMRINLALQRIQLRIPAGDFLFIKLIYQDVQLKAWESRPISSLPLISIFRLKSSFSIRAICPVRFFILPVK